MKWAVIIQFRLPSSFTQWRTCECRRVSQAISTVSVYLLTCTAEEERLAAAVVEFGHEERTGFGHFSADGRARRQPSRADVHTHIDTAQPISVWVLHRTANTRVLTLNSCFLHHCFILQASLLTLHYLILIIPLTTPFFTSSCVLSVSDVRRRKRPKRLKADEHFWPNARISSKIKYSWYS